MDPQTFTKIMKPLLALLTLFLMSVSANGEPMIESVSSWEGEFLLIRESIPIQVPSKSPLDMWLYKLKTGSEGNAIGFSDQHGNMMLAPHPKTKGVQPIYQSHVVTFASNGNAEVIVVYTVQGNGGLKYVEKYEYDGKVLSLKSRSHYGGRHSPAWHQVKDRGQDSVGTTPPPP